MKVPMQILSISAGKLDNGGDLYASVIILDSEQNSQITPERIDVGQKHAKVKVSTDNDNQLCRTLATSGQVPGTCLVDIETTVKKGEMVIKIVGFQPSKAA